MWELNVSLYVNHLVHLQHTLSVQHMLAIIVAAFVLILDTDSITKEANKLALMVNVCDSQLVCRGW